MNGKIINIQINSSPLAELGFSKEQVNVLTKSNRQITPSGTIISGVVHSGKTMVGAKIIKKMCSERRFKAKRQRREIKNRK